MLESELQEPLLSPSGFLADERVISEWVLS